MGGVDRREVDRRVVDRRVVDSSGGGDVGRRTVDMLCMSNDRDESAPWSPRGTGQRWGHSQTRVQHLFNAGKEILSMQVQRDANGTRPFLRNTQCLLVNAFQITCIKMHDS